MGKRAAWLDRHVFMVVLISCVLFFGTIGASVLWALYGPSEPIVISSLTVAPTVTPGEPFIYHVHACKYLDTKSDLYTQIIGVGKTTFSYSYQGVRHGVAHTGCHVTSVVIPPPVGLPPGTYVLRNEAVYQVNPLRQVTVPSQSNVFRITS